MASFLGPIAAVLSAVSSILPILGIGQDDQKALPAPGFSPAAGPQAPTQTPDQSKFDAPGQLAQAPAYLQLSSGMTPLQQRTKIATGAVSGESGGYRDPQAQQYYRDLALNSLVGPGGEAMEGANIADVERRFVEEVLGETIRQPTSASFLSALMRGVG